MAKRKPTRPFVPRVVDNLPNIPTLPECKRLDALLGGLVAPLIGHTSRPDRVEADAQRGRSRAHHARPKRRRQTT